MSTVVEMESDGLMRCSDVELRMHAFADCFDLMVVRKVSVSYIHCSMATAIVHQINIIAYLHHSSHCDVLIKYHQLESRRAQPSNTRGRKTKAIRISSSRLPFETS